jgi:hypothetical protein
VKEEVELCCCGHAFTDHAPAPFARKPVAICTKCQCSNFDEQCVCGHGKSKHDPVHYPTAICGDVYNEGTEDESLCDCKGFTPARQEGDGR